MSDYRSRVQTATYNMGGNLWVKRSGLHVYIRNDDTDDVVALYIPQGDCERVAEALTEIAERYDAEQKNADEQDKLQRLVEGRGLSGEA